MSEELILNNFLNLRTWATGDHRAVHKPLLLLYALGQLQVKHEQLSYDDVDEALKELLKSFGPNLKSYNTHYPFWRLKKDGIWVLENSEKIEENKSGDVKKSDLNYFSVTGGYKTEIIQLFKKKPKLLEKVTKEILSAHFPETWHTDILNAVGLEFNQEQYYSVKNKRDPAFRKRVLTAYKYNCAICGLSIQIGDHWPTLEAAHIKWHQASGPDIESNGLALCNTHHKLFDRGGFTLDDGNKLLASEALHGNGLEEIILKFHGKEINKPIRSSYTPDQEFLGWHRREVFHGREREF